MKYGHFDDARREYVIQHPDTPLPWINYLGSQGYYALISNTGGGYSFYQDARLRRITRYRYNNVPLDEGGRYVYVRDELTGKFWSPSWQPTRTPLSEYECRHGLGYTIISGLAEGIRASTRYFVPLNEQLEIWDMTLTNERLEDAALSMFSFVEFALWDAQDDATNYQRNFNTGEVEIEDGVIYHRTEYRERRNHFAYFACSHPLAGYDTQRESFLGAYGGLHAPQAVVEGRARNSHAHGWAPVGSHHVRLMLAPGESKRIIFILGYGENDPQQKYNPPEGNRLNKVPHLPRIQKYMQAAAVDQAFDALSQHWSTLLSGYQVEAPDLHTNRMVNIWNAYQCMVTFNLSRSASYFESGVGRGMGFRDSTQDLLGFVHMIPERARERILDLAATQLATGGAYHQYQPLTKRGNDAVGGNFNDDPLWLVLAVTAYLKETGDFSILEERVPYDHAPGSEAPLYEHLERSMQYTKDRLGPHGLPLIGRADWNDCLNLNTFSVTPGESFQTTTNKDGKTAESVFIAGLYTLAASEMAGLARQLGDEAAVERFEVDGAEMAVSTLDDGWDGEWFLRAYDDAGEVVGSHTCDEGKIFIEPQGMCVMAGIGRKSGHARKALDSVASYLATKHGLVLLQPAYTSYRVNLGEITSYPPGYKENASVFCHTNPWVMIAEALMNNGDAAFDYYHRINPSAREEISDIHRCEPYVYAQMIAGRDAPTFGEAKNSWLTGTAAWNYVAITQYILGIRPDYDGLLVDPAVPKRWGGFKAARVFRGVVYDIEVTRLGSSGSMRLVVDGQEIPGIIVPRPVDGRKRVRVEVALL